MKPSFKRIRVLRPETPLYLRPEPWLLVAALAYFTYDKVNFYAPLLYQQRFPQGAPRALSNEVDRFFNEHDFWQEAWALPVRDYQRGNGQCLILKPGPEDAPLATSVGDPVAFAAALPANNFEVGFRCQQEGSDQFDITFSPGSAAEFHRGPGAAVGLLLKRGRAEIILRPHRAAEILLPQGVLPLSSNAGGRLSVAREGGLLRVTGEEGEVHLTAELSAEYREKALGVELNSAEGGKLFVPERHAALKPGKPVRLAPSGVYEQETP